MSQATRRALIQGPAHGLVSFIPEHGQRRPLGVLKAPGGLDLLRGLLLQVQSSTFS